MAILFSAIMFFIIAIPDLINLNIRKIPSNAWIIIIILGIINSALAYLTWDYSIKKIGAVDAGLFYYTLPIFTIPSAYYFLNEKLYETQLWGAIAIIIGIFAVLSGEDHKNLSR